MLSEQLKEFAESKEWLDITAKAEALSEEWNELLLDGGTMSSVHYSKADLFRKEIAFVEGLVNMTNEVVDETIRNMLIDDLNKSINWRKDILLGRTNDMGLDRTDEEYFFITDVYRKYNFWIECLKNLPIKLADIEAKKEETEAQIEISDLDDSYASLSQLNAGL